ncbi:uncharacterized protein DFL_008339 [Arthrobotrys flagrans]|uniref:Uncharacterized protein n=1 Tax=Arthrobotrys flagrans TaxID=97331 RepID=A0A436ZNR3_ARTFL|nr:hypothetical protein DFL_008339 [Arthrobotrys flagrans]
MAPFCNTVGEEGVDRQTLALSAKHSILERLVRALIAENLVNVSQFTKAGISLPIQTSLCGRVTVSGPVYAEFGNPTETKQIVDPIDLLDELEKAGVLHNDAGWTLARNEIENSLNNLTQALGAEQSRSENFRSLFQHKFDARTPFSSLVTALTETGYGKHALGGFEQLVVDGHPLTPAGKVRTGMSSADAARYGPEFGSKFGLRFVAVAKDYVEAEDGTCGEISKILRVNPIQDTGVDAFNRALSNCYKDTFEDLRRELIQMGKQPDDFVMIPVHPHQLDNAIPKLHAEALASKTVIPVQSSLTAHPLMSYRTFAVKGRECKGLHIKTALEVQLTGAIRGISSASARNAPRMSRLLALIIAGDTDLQRTDSAGHELFIPERALAAVAFKASKRSLAAILRDDIENDMAEDEVALPVASLFARSPFTGNPILLDLIAELGTTPTAWLRALVEVCVPPCLIFLSRYGISLEPHPQNTVVILRKGWPCRMHVRDFGGARILPSRLAKQGFSIELDSATGLVIASSSEDEGTAVLRAKLFYPLFGNNLAEVIATLAKENITVEEELWGVVRSVVRQTGLYLGTKEALEDVKALLENPWRRKCLLSMRLAGAVTDQRYVDGPNPLRVSPIEPPSPSTFWNRSEQTMFEYLSENEPKLCLLWRQQLPRARQSIEEDYQASLTREGVQDNAEIIRGVKAEWEQLKLELEDSATNLALSRVLVNLRGQQLRERAGTTDHDFLSVLLGLYSPSDITLELDDFDAEGHPTHPCRRTRLRFSPSDSLAFAPDSGTTISGKIVAVQRDQLVLSDPSFSDILRKHYPFINDAASAALCRDGKNPNEFELVLVHPFQFATVLPRIYKSEISSGVIVPLPEVTIACRATSSTRTLVSVTPGIQGKRLSFKTAIDVQITSTCRTISHESVRNGPYVSALLTRLLSGETRVSCIGERASIAFSPETNCTNSRQRGLSMLLRDDVADYIKSGEVIIGCTALITKSPISGKPLVVELVNSLAQNSGNELAAREFVDKYADLLLSAALPLVWKHGIALEAHLQNTLLVLDASRNPVRLLLRDFAGLRVNLDRLKESGEDITKIPCPKSRAMSADDEEIHCKFTHSVIFTNLVPVVDALSEIVSPLLLWEVIRARAAKVHERFTAKLSKGDSNMESFANEHFQRLTSTPALPQKALLTMRVLAKASGGMDYYTMQPNPLYSGLANLGTGQG